MSGIAAVTGASRGIGRATVLELARRGYRVFALARSEAELRSLTDEATGRGYRVEPVVMDIADDGSRRKAVEEIMARTDGHGLDVLVNNAGYGQLGPLEEVSPEALRRQLEVNVIGLHAFTLPFIPGMRERRNGTIVNVSSIAGRFATPFMGAYNASKFALEGMSDSLRLELAPFGVRVILIQPGPIKTAFGEAAAAAIEPHSDSPYRAFEQGWGDAKGLSDRFERSPQAVARAIGRAVSSAHPRPRYTITLSAKLGTVAYRLLPDLARDWILRRVAGLTTLP